MLLGERLHHLVHRARRELCGGAGQPSPTTSANFTGRSLNVATGPTGGVYIVYGAGIANVLTQKLGVAANAQVTPASVEYSR